MHAPAFMDGLRKEAFHSELAVPRGGVRGGAWAFDKGGIKAVLPLGPAGGEGYSGAIFGRTWVDLGKGESCS